MEGGRDAGLYAPVDELFGKLGYTVSYDSADNTVHVNSGTGPVLELSLIHISYEAVRSFGRITLRRIATSVAITTGDFPNTVVTQSGNSAREAGAWDCLLYTSRCV